MSSLQVEKKGKQLQSVYNTNMKDILLIFFTLLSPLAVFLTMIAFMPHLNTTIKEQLVKAHAYEKVSEQMSTLTADDADSAAINSILQHILTPEYLQGKTETTIDMSYNWIVGTTTIPPVLSFKDIKEDIVRQNPQLLTTIEELSKEVKDAQSFGDIVTAKNPGDKIVVNYKNRTGEHETTITLEESPYFEVATYEKAGKELAKEQTDFRNNWLSTKVR